MAASFDYMDAMRTLDSLLDIRIYVYLKREKENQSSLLFLFALVQLRLLQEIELPLA